jgi:hypothetical protein
VAAIAVGTERSGALFMVRSLAHAVRPRAGDRLARGGPVQFQWWVRILERQSHGNSRYWRGDGCLRDCGMI